MSTPHRDALDRLDRLGTCLRAVTDLLNPEKDLHTVDRDALCILMDFLCEEHQTALGALIHAQPVRIA